MVRKYIKKNNSENFIVIGANDGVDNDVIKEVIYVKMVFAIWVYRR